METAIWQSLFPQNEKFKDERSNSVINFCSQNACRHLGGSDALTLADSSPSKTVISLRFFCSVTAI